MTSFCFDDLWEVWCASDESVTPVCLPHDAMLGEGRRADAPSGAHQAFFLGGTYRYRKTWFASSDLAGKIVSLLFEGVYRHSRVCVNGQDVGGAIGGYLEFEVRIDSALNFGADNVIEVSVDNANLPGERWYSGSGIYRPVQLRVVDAIHIKRDGIRFRTSSIDDSSHEQWSRVSIDVDTVNPNGEPLEIIAVLAHEGVEVARGVVSGGAQATSSANIELQISAPKLWSAETPNLYDCTVRVFAGNTLRDERTEKVGLRTIEISGRAGLRVNGKRTLLRGANIHHDNGVLGAATFRDAEFRRVRILKENGFNAIRSAHNPISRALLEACDELGMYVMDELYDGWYDHKTTHDDAPHFAATWEAAIDAMVAKSRLHPCVIMYSIGNENSEPVTNYGIETVRRLAGRVRKLDPERAVTAGVNILSAALGWPTERKGSVDEQPASLVAPNMNSTMINVITNQFGRLVKWAPRLKRTDAATRDMFALLDVAGYNYGTVRYERDAKLHPDRVIVGTETFPGDITTIWPLVERIPNVIGDFMWSGWDYLGEAGIGTWEYDTSRSRLQKPYPYLVAGCGAIDITGVPGAFALLAQVTWGLINRPVIAVRPLDVSDKKFRKTAWRSTDAIPSWAWRGCEGKQADIEVFSRDDEIELLINGRSLGRRKTVNRIARFRAPYQSGEITAVGYRAGEKTGSSTLRSAGRARLRLIAETLELKANGQDLAFLRVELADEHGVIEMLDDDQVQISIEGAASLAGFGSAAPATEESFVDDVHRTYRGRALAVIRAGTRPDAIRVTATSLRHGTVSVEIVQS